MVPEEYITNGGDDGSTGVMLKTYDKHGNQHNTFKKKLRFIIKMKKQMLYRCQIVFGR